MDDEIISIFQQNANEYANKNDINGLITLYDQYGIFPDSQSIINAIIDGRIEVIEFLDDRNVELTDEQINLVYFDNIAENTKQWIMDYYISFTPNSESVNYSENLSRSGELHIDKMQAKGFLLEDSDDDDYPFPHHTRDREESRIDNLDYYEL